MFKIASDIFIHAFLLFLGLFLKIFRWAPLWMGVRIIQSFSNDDGDGNENVKKANSCIEQNNKFARASRFFVHFFAVTAPLRRENA